MAFKIITDSTSDISPELARELDIEIVPLKVNFGSDIYVDKITISNEEFFEKLSVSKELPTTTLVNVDEFVSVFNKYPDDDLLCIFVSPKLSGTYNSAVLAKEDVHRDNIYIVDSTSVTIGLSLLVFEAVDLRAKGLPVLEIYKQLCDLAGKIRIYAMIDVLKYLVKGGRIGAVSGAIGSALGIKPIICVSDGVINKTGKARGLKEATQLLFDTVKDTCKLDAERKVLFAHSSKVENLETLINLFENEYNIKSAGEFFIGSVVGTHAGPGAIAISFFIK